MPVIPSPNAIYSHSTTGKLLLKRALRVIRAIDPGEDIAAAELSDGKEALNQMLDSWNGEKLMVPALGRNQFTLVGGTAAYSVGPAGDFDLPQIIKIEQGDAYIKLDNLEFELEVLTQPQFAGIALKTTSTRPCQIYYEMASPRGTANFYPVPDAAYTFIHYARQLLAQVVQMEETINLLPGYAEAIVFNLAIRQAPEYGKTASAEVIASAVESKATIKRNNIKPSQLEGDPALANRGGRGWMVSGAFESGGF